VHQTALGIRVELFVQNVVEFLAEIGILCGCDPGLAPLGTDPHLTHVFSNCALSDGIAFLAQLGSDFRGTVVLLGLIVDPLDVFLYSFSSLLCGRGFVMEEGTVS